MRLKLKSISNQLKENQFLKASFFSVLSSSVKIITVLLVGKVIAIKSGSEGMAMYGQLLNFVTIVAVIAGGSINEGIIKYVAEYRGFENTKKLRNLLSTSFKFLIICSLFFGIIIAIYSKTASNLVFHSDKYQKLFYVFGFSISIFGLNNYLLSILNGYKNFIKFNIINIVINLVNLTLTVLLIYFQGLLGALLSVVISQSIMVFFTLFLLRKELWLSKDNFSLPFHYQSFKLLMSFSVLSLLTTAMTPVVSIIIRNLIIENISLSAAGQYEFVTRISSSALIVFSLAVSTYYLPRISEIVSKTDLFKEVLETYKIIFPVSLIVISCVFFLRIFIIKTLASDSFLESKDLFFFQLMGVLFRVLAQVLGFVFLAKAKIRIIIITEIVFNFFYISTTFFLIKKYGIEGCPIAYFINNFIYFVVVLLLFSKIFNKPQKDGY